MQVQTPEVGAEKANTDRPVSLKMLAQRIATIRNRSAELSEIELVAYFNRQSLALNVVNFQLADCGRVEIKLPASLVRKLVHDQEQQLLQMVDDIRSDRDRVRDSLIEASNLLTTIAQSGHVYAECTDKSSPAGQRIAAIALAAQASPVRVCNWPLCGDSCCAAAVNNSAEPGAKA